MNVLIINGSPHENGCTATALGKVAEGLAHYEVESEFVWLGKEPVRGCVACGGCNKTQRCAFGADDGVNDLIEKLIVADALVVGSPTHYAGIAGALKATLDRVFYAASSLYAFKPGAAVVSARRAGTTAALEQLNKYFLISQMPMAASFYWPMVHGHSAEQVLQDEEGCAVAWQLGANLAWLIKSIEVGKDAGVEPFIPEKRVWTNFIR